MRRIISLTNTQSPDSDYPYGRVKNNTGSGDGTPVNEALLGDIIQFFSKLMDGAGITGNDLPDNEYSGFQLYEALSTLMALKANVSQEDWDTPGGGSAGAVFWRKDGFGFVHLMGVLGDDTLTTFTLPVGYRPASTVTVYANLNNNTSGGSSVSTVVISTGGVVSCVGVSAGGDNTSVEITGISFKSA